MDDNKMYRQSTDGSAEEGGESALLPHQRLGGDSVSSRTRNRTPAQVQALEALKREARLGYAPEHVALRLLREE